MKRIAFFLSIFTVVAIASGFCRGSGGSGKPKPTDPNAAAAIANLTKENEDLKNKNDQLIKDIADLKAHKERLAPVTWEIVEEAGYKTLRELDYYLSAPLKLVMNNHDRKLAANNGTLTIEEKNAPEEVTIESTYKGKLQNSNPKEKGSFVVNFQDKNISLKFDRDKEKNIFVLVEVVNSPKNLSLHPDGIPPYLCILLDYKNDSKNPMIRNVSSTVPVTPGKPSVKPYEPPQEKNLPIMTPIMIIRSEIKQPMIQQFPSRNLMGNGILTRDSVVGYIQSRNRTLSPEIIDFVISTYIVEARKENINHDIAIAQMCEGTAYLNRREVLSTYNFGDLRVIRGAVNRFPTIQLGVRAHIQQLKGYASPYGPTAERQVDATRISGIGRNTGRITTLDELFPFWVTGNLYSYRNEINAILAEMYFFQERQ